MDGIETDIDDFLTWGKGDDEHDKKLIQCLKKTKKNWIDVELIKVPIQMRRIDLFSKLNFK